MRHVKSIDGAQHTVIMVQVENESGSVGSIRDYSPAAQKAFEAEVPAEFARALHLRPGNWTQAFGPDADESFAAYSTAHYIDEVVAAGKAEYPLPMYCNVWFAYPVHALENRDRPSAGQEYPSGGPQQANIAIWKAAAPAIDILAPDFYSDDFTLFRSIVATYARPTTRCLSRRATSAPPSAATSSMRLDTAPLASLRSASTAPCMPAVPNPQGIIASAAVERVNPAENYALFNAPEQQIAQLNLDGKLYTAVEDKGAARQSIHLPDADAVVSFGFPQPDGTYPPGTPNLQGRALVAQLGPLDFLVTGFDVSVSFAVPAAALKSSRTSRWRFCAPKRGSTSTASGRHRAF